MPATMGGFRRSAGPSLLGPCASCNGQRLPRMRQLLWSVLTFGHVLAASCQGQRGSTLPARSANLRASAELRTNTLAQQFKHRADDLEAEKRKLVGRLLESEKARADQVKDLEARYADLEKRFASEHASSVKDKEKLVEAVKAAQAQAQVDAIHLANEELSREEPAEGSLEEDTQLLWAAGKLAELRSSNAKLSAGLEKERTSNAEVQKQVKKFVKQDLERVKAHKKQVMDLHHNNTVLKDLLKNETRALTRQEDDLEREHRREARDEAEIRKLQGKLQAEKDEVSSLLVDKQSLMTTVKGLLSEKDSLHGKAERQKNQEKVETDFSKKLEEQDRQMQAKTDAMYYMQSQLARLESNITNITAVNQRLKTSQSTQLKKFQEEQASLLRKLKATEEQYEREEVNSNALLAKLNFLKAKNGNLNAAVDKEIRQVDTISKVQSDKLHKLKAMNQKLYTAWQKALNVSDSLRQDDRSKGAQLTKLEEKLQAEDKLQDKYKTEAAHEKQVTDQKLAINGKLRSEMQKALNVVEELKQLKDSKDKQLVQLKEKYDEELEMEEKYKAEADPTLKNLNEQFRSSIKQYLASNKELKHKVVIDAKQFEKERSALTGKLRAAMAEKTALETKAAKAEEQNARLAAEVEHMEMLKTSLAVLQRDKRNLAENMLALNDTLQQEKHALEVKLQQAEDRIERTDRNENEKAEKSKDSISEIAEKEGEMEAELRLSQADLQKERAQFQAVLKKEKDLKAENRELRADVKEQGGKVVAALQKEAEIEAEMRMTQRTTDMKTKAMWKVLKKNSDLKSAASALRARNKELEEKNKKLAGTVRTLQQVSSDERNSDERSSDESLEDGTELDDTSAPDTASGPDAPLDARSELAALDKALKKRLKSETSLD